MYFAPTYLANVCQPVASVGSRQRLRSTTYDDLAISPTVMYFDTWSFAVSGPKAWNQPLADLCANCLSHLISKCSEDIPAPLPISYVMPL